MISTPEGQFVYTAGLLTKFRLFLVHLFYGTKFLIICLLYHLTYVYLHAVRLTKYSNMLTNDLIE